jgi:hypothetical protein
MAAESGDKFGLVSDDALQCGKHFSWGGAGLESSRTDERRDERRAVPNVSLTSPGVPADSAPLCSMLARDEVPLSSDT